MSIQPVIESLHQIEKIHAELLELAERKTQVLIDNKVDELTQITSRETKLLKAVEDAERQRVQTSNDYLQGKGLAPNAAITGSELAKYVFNPGEKSALLERQTQLASLLQQLKETHEVNKHLIEQSLDYIQYSIDVLTYDDSDDAVYHHPSKQEHGAQRSGIFETKI